ncbi:MAG TPA: rhomboid family intramembrane serine protease [Bryobacteraceae bacterium]|jgi:rhomboid protease GluP
MCPNCRAFITTDDKVCPYCEVQIGKKAVDRGAPADVMGGLIPQHRFTTVMILLINTGLYVATLIYSAKSGHGMGTDLDSNTLYDFGAKAPAILFGQWWRLITAGFLHGGLMHILMNSWVLWDIGVQVEQSYGTSRYLVIYLVSTITGFLGSLLWAPGVLSIGASAGIFGLFGAMIALGLRDRSSYGTAVRQMYLRWAGLCLVIGILPAIFGISFMDNAAHIGGITGGFVVAYVAGTPKISGMVEAFWRGACGVMLAVTAVAFVQMFLALVGQKPL